MWMYIIDPQGNWADHSVWVQAVVTQKDLSREKIYTMVKYVDYSFWRLVVH